LYNEILNNGHKYEVAVPAPKHSTMKPHYGDIKVKIQAPKSAVPLPVSHPKHISNFTNITLERLSLQMNNTL
jgi:hypothetical protein